jgi:phenylacetate-CoA ligase
LYIYTSEYPANSVFGLYPSYFIETLNDIQDTKKKIIELMPDIICLYPSHLRELAKIFTDDEIKNLNLKAIITGSEMSSKKERYSLSQRFLCPVYDEYSSEELGWIAAECRFNKYHIYEDLNFIECLDDPKGGTLSKGRIIGTNLCNYEMPFIRYDQGDMGKITNGICSCGSNLLCISEIFGRENDQFRIHGKTYSPGFLLDMTYGLVLKLKLDISEFCLIQEKKDRVILELACEKISRDDKNKVIKYIQGHLGNICINVKRVKTTYRSKSGKKNPIISRISR